MCAVYRVSSSVKVEQMEAELSRQLSELRMEMEENGFPPAVPRSYSSVPPPEDVWFFRAERERALRRGLQVANALPLQCQADVMQRELESCLRSEYTPDSLPPLLHQFYVDRSYHLAQIKYVLMLRWRRFCRHTSAIEKLYPHYKNQMCYLTSEYEDAVQRARRLAASRETILTGRGDPGHLVARDDVVIYLRWLVCHLHSVQTIHSLLRVLHYIPACERTNKDSRSTVRKDHDRTHCADAAGVSGADDVPLHVVHLGEFSPELQSLITFFHLSYDARKIKTAADEMELFSTVWREFRTTFRQQEQMRTFLQYDSTKAKESQWGRKSSSMALKKEAIWIPFIQVKPKRDPWQQKVITKLKERKRVDELLKMHCRFLQVSDVLHVASVLKDRAAHVVDLRSAPTSSTSRSSDTKPRKFSEIWMSIYNATFTQESNDFSSRSKGRGGLDKKSQMSSATTESLQLLGLDDSPEEGTSDPSVPGGAYLSLTYLRHLKLRELQRISLGMLNYLRSVERTLTFDLAGLQLEEGELFSTAEETGFMNAARGGRGEAGGLNSLQYIHNTPVDYKVHCSEFMEFAEVENLQDFYSSQQRFIHTQDHRGFYVMYDAALRDLEELEDELLLVGSHFIQRNRIRKHRKTDRAFTSAAAADIHLWAGTEVDRVAVLLDLWTCETEFLEHKVQLLNCYYEAYQHTAGAEEKFALARVITDIMHSRPHMDLKQDYFVQAYRAEISCMQSHQQLITAVLDSQIEKQRQYLQRIWRDDHTGSAHHYGLPPDYVPKHLVSLGGSSPALKNVFLLEVHPSLCMASAVYQGLVQAHAELCQLHRATSVTDKLVLQQKLLQQALKSWDCLATPGTSYSSQIQKDLFSGVFFEDPVLVQMVGMTIVRSAEEKDVKQGKEKQSYAVETFSKLLELVTIRHRLLESASETEHLAQLYKDVASELGFGEFHLYLRPVHFEVAEQKHRVEKKPVFITAILEDDSSVDRFIPSHLPLSIQELDENQFGKFSFSSQEAVIHLMNKQSMENLQVTLACQLTQKNALISAVKLACFCHWAHSVNWPAESTESLHSDKDVKENTKERLTESFVSIQLEKVGLRDDMLNSFMKKKQAVGGLIKTPEEAEKIKRRLIIDFLKKFSTQISQYCVRAQVVAHYYSLSSLLDDFPSVRLSHFIIGQASGSKLDSGADPSTVETRPQQLLSSDGNALLNLWYIPHFSEVLHIFKTLDISACAAALHRTLQIVSGLHDIIYYLVSFSRLGNTDSSCCRTGEEERGSHVAADWGGVEGVEAELQELQLQVQSLGDPSSPESVGRLLQSRRQVLLLQFDAAVRHLIREAFLSSGDMTSYQSVSDNMTSALPLLSDSIQTHVFSLTLPVPQPLETKGSQAQQMYPWRSFLGCHGLLPLHVWDVPPIEHCMQLCLSGLRDRSRLQANAAILGVSLLMEDVLNSGRHAEPVRLHSNRDDLPHGEKPSEGDKLVDTEEEVKRISVSDSCAPLQDPIHVQSVLRGFLLLTKQLHVFKESWARRRLGVEMFNTPAVYEQFAKLYRAEIFHPSMRALAQQLGKEQDYEGSLSLLPPPGASEVDVKSWQLHSLLESTECDLIRAVQKKINTETTLAVSERTRQDTLLPTELWKKSTLKHSLSSERPHIVETFIQHLMEGAEQAEGQVEERPGSHVRFSPQHLQRCLAELGCSVMERERRSFLLYSQFYEQILQQETQLLYHKEQDLKDLMDSQTRSPYKETEELHVVRHQSAQDARSRHDLDTYRMQTLEQMRVDAEDRERQLRTLSERLDRGSRMNQLQRQRSSKHIRQVKGQLQQERCLKQEAFEQVEKLQRHMNNGEAASSRRTSTAGLSRTYYSLSVSRLSTRNPSAGLQRASQQQSTLQLGSLTNFTSSLQDFVTEPRHQKAQTTRSRSNASTDRAKADPCRVHPVQTLLPNL